MAWEDEDPAYHEAVRQVHAAIAERAQHFAPGPEDLDGSDEGAGEDGWLLDGWVLVCSWTSAKTGAGYLGGGSSENMRTHARKGLLFEALYDTAGWGD